MPYLSDYPPDRIHGITTRYQLAWGGEYEDATLVQNSLTSALSGGFFNDDTDHHLTVWKGRQPLIIWLTVPLAIIGITA